MGGLGCDRSSGSGRDASNIARAAAETMQLRLVSVNMRNRNINRKLTKMGCSAP